MDACTLLRLAGRHAVPLPLAEGGLLGGWLLAAAGLELPGGPVTVAVPSAADRLVIEDGKVTGTLARVPWGARAEVVVALAAAGPTPADGTRVVALDPALASVQPGHNVAGEPRDRLTWDGAPRRMVGTPQGDVAAELALRGALSRALLMAGAMEAAADLTVDYAGQRQQFGRPIAAFQAVGQRLVRMSSEAEAGILATEVAARRFAEVGVEAGFEVGVAKASAGRAASEVAAHAHQVHGAIGMTREYTLHHFTRRLWTWRQEWGSEATLVPGGGGAGDGGRRRRPLAPGGDRAGGCLMSSQPTGSAGVADLPAAAVAARASPSSAPPRTRPGCRGGRCRSSCSTGSRATSTRSTLATRPSAACRPTRTSRPCPARWTWPPSSSRPPWCRRCCANAPTPGCGPPPSSAPGSPRRGWTGVEPRRRSRPSPARPVCGCSGPNAEGFFNLTGGIPVTFSPTVDYERGLTRLVPGNVAVVSQSGGLGFALFNWGQAVGLGSSYVVSTGNEADLGALEIAAYLLEDAATDVVALLVEGFPRQ